MQITEIMSSPVVTVQMDSSLAYIRQIFKNREIDHIVVVSNQIMGVISDRDIRQALSPVIDTLAATTKDEATLQKRAHQVMTRDPITLTKSALIDDAIAIFCEHKISCIPIVDQDNRAVGMVSLRDIIKAFPLSKIK